MIVKLASGETVLVISDLHLGNKTRSDDFSYTAYRLLRDAEKNLINWITKINPTYLVLAGDIEELWQHNIIDVKRVYKELYSFFASRKTIKLRGNHDWSSDGETHVIFQIGGRSVYIAHGHEDDASMHSSVVKTLVWAFGLVEKVFPNLELVYSYLAGGNRATKIYKKTLELAKKKLASYTNVVFGHTHVHEQLSRYFNSGTCQNGALQGVFIDACESKLTLVNG